MKQLKTLRVRFALWTAGLLLVALVLFGLFVYIRMSKSLANLVDDALKTVASQIINEVDVEDGILVSVNEFIEEMPDMPLLEQGFSFRLFDSTGQTLQRYGPYQNLPQPQANFTIPNPSARFITFIDAATQHRVRVYTAPVMQHNQLVGVLQVAQNLINTQQTLNQLLATLLVGVPVVVVAAGSGGYMLAARAMAPIDKIIRTTQRISAENLSARLNLPFTDDEVGRLAATFDSMLSRLDDAFQRQRQFTADASHELRTPLTTMQTILSSTLVRRRAPDEYEQAMADLFEETNHMRQLTEGLLLLARSDNASDPATCEPVNLSHLLRDVSDSLRPLAEKKGLKLTAHFPDDLTLVADPDALIRMFMNLVGNAIKYTERGQITIVAHSRPDRFAEVTISDTGPGIAPEHLPHVFDRFYRVDESRSTEGTGLGLAIALNVAQAHGGTIEITSEIQQGTIFTVTLATE